MSKISSQISPPCLFHSVITGVALGEERGQTPNGGGGALESLELNILGFVISDF